MNAHAGFIVPSRWPEAQGHPVLLAARPGPGPTPPAIVHVVPSLSMGGAERIVLDLAGSAAARGVPMRVAVMRAAPVAHEASPAVEPLLARFGSLPWPERLDRAAALIRESGLPGMCHLTSQGELEGLWARGADTVPVVHNARSGWGQDPRNWERGRVPYAVACGDAVARDLAEAGCPVPVAVIRHVVPVPAKAGPGLRDRMRAAFSAGDGTLLIGMTGRVVPQKRHVRAVQVLAELVRRGRDARLAVIGKVDPAADGGAHAAAVSIAEALGVRDRVVFLGAVQGAAALVSAFDVHLNVSAFEGVSIATMEAVAAGVPVVSLRAGGQDEALGKGDILLSQDAAASEIADAVEARILDPGGGPAAHQEAFRHAAADLWAWTAAFRSASGRGAAADVMFVTGNMDVGGAQRSLGILAAELARRGKRIVVGVCGRFGVPEFLSQAVAEGAAVLDLSGGDGPLGGPAGRIGRILSAVGEARPRTVCFWNMDAVGKAGVAKVLRGSGIAVCEASPGPALFRELGEARRELSLLSTSPEDYLAGLDAFAAKYAGGISPSGPTRQAVIPNGVPVAVPLPDGEGPHPPPGCDPSKAVLVVGRLNGAKRIDLLPAVARGLAARVPGATLTVVGGLHADGAALEPAPGLRLVPPDTRATGFASRFACLLMLSAEQGCPNASLEAMAAGIPVVANDDGGTAEQVVDGVTGRLLRAEGAGLVEEAVAALAELVEDPGAARAMGRAARERAADRFSVAAMADGYEALFEEGERV